MLIGLESASGDRELRRRVVAAFPEFLSRCTRGHAVLEAVAAEYSLPSYLLGLMNTAYLTAEQSAITEADLRSANPGSERSRPSRVRGRRRTAAVTSCYMSMSSSLSWA